MTRPVCRNPQPCWRPAPSSWTPQHLSSASSQIGSADSPRGTVWDLSGLQELGNTPSSEGSKSQVPGEEMVRLTRSLNCLARLKLVSDQWRGWRRFPLTESTERSLKSRHLTITGRNVKQSQAIFIILINALTSHQLWSSLKMSKFTFI